MSENRKRGLCSMENLLVPSVLLDAEGIASRILPEFPLHPAYKYLSENHKSDYLRCYFMHHFGGGYADIKTYSRDNNWAECFDYINAHPEVDVVGQAEIKRGSPIPELNSPDKRKFLVANGYFIVRPRSAFSSEWWKRVNARLDARLAEVKAHPAESPRDGGRHVKKNSKYPIRWAELQGEIFHRLCYDMRDSGAVCAMLRTGRTNDAYL